MILVAAEDPRSRSLSHACDQMQIDSGDIKTHEVCRMLRLVCDALSLTSAGKMKTAGDEIPVFCFFFGLYVRVPVSPWYPGAFIDPRYMIMWAIKKTTVECVTPGLDVAASNQRLCVCVHRSQSGSLTYTMCELVLVFQRPPFIHSRGYKISLISKLTCAILFLARVLRNRG